MVLQTTRQLSSKIHDGKCDGKTWAFLCPLAAVTRRLQGEGTPLEACASFDDGRVVLRAHRVI